MQYLSEIKDYRKKKYQNTKIRSLSIYKNQRNQLIKISKIKIKNKKNFIFKLNTKEYLNNKNEIHIQAFLINCLLKKKLNLKEIKILNNLIIKFEIFLIIRKKYDINFKKINNDMLNPNEYIIFAYILISNNIVDKYRNINIILKLVDYISINIKKISNYKYFFYLIKILDYEKNIIDKLQK